MQNKVYSLLGICLTSGNLISGESLLDAIRKHKVTLVIIAEDASDNTKKKIMDKCHYYHIDYFIYGNIDDLSNSIGKHRVAVGIKSQGFSNKIKSYIGG